MRQIRTNDKNLIDLYLSSGQGFRQLHGRINPAIQSALHTRNGSPVRVDPEDCTQQIWYRLLRQDGRLLKVYNPERGRLETYIYRVTRSVLREMEQTAAPADPTDVMNMDALTCAEPSQRHRVLNADHFERLAQALDEGLETDGTIIWRLFYIDGYSTREISKQIKKSNRFVTKQLRKVRDRAKLLTEAFKDQAEG